MENKKRSYQEIIKDCFENKDNNEEFNKYCTELINNTEFRKKISPRLDNELGDIYLKLREIIEKEKHFLKCYDISYLAKCLINEKNRNSFKLEEEQIAIQENKRIKQLMKKYKEEHQEDEDLKDAEILKIINTPVLSMQSLDVQKNVHQDSSITLEETIKDEKILTPTENLEKQEQYYKANLFIKKSLEIKQELCKVFDKLEKNKKQKKIINRDFATFIMLCTCLCQPDYIYNDIYDLMNKLCAWSDDKEYSKMLYHLCKNNSLDDYNEHVTKGIKIKPKHRKFIDKFLHYCKKHNIELKHIIRKRFSTSLYAAIIEYLIIEYSEENKKQKRINTINKLSIPELITDFNKIRNYLSILFIQDDINNKSDFIEKSRLSDSSYEKDIRRILSLFNKSEEKIFNIKKELKEFKPNKLGKIYETHTVPNLVSNLLILDVLSQYKSEQTEQFEKIKLTTIINELFKNSDYNEKDIFNFRKYNLLPRLKELEEYGFVSRDNDKYSLNTHFFTDEQKKSLEFVVPFFCGIYPFSSIGHSLANRLDIKNKFKIEQYNASNTLEDCIVYDLLNAINNKEKIKIVFKGNEEIFKEVTPIELFIEKKSNLLKLKDNKKEYYLHDIQGFPDEEFQNSSKTKKSKKIKLKKSPIFNEIYSFYYKIFEEVVAEYKKDERYDVTKAIKNYGSNDTRIYSDIIEELIPKLAKLKNITIPLTKLELRWLKTIMQDVRFDLFVTNDEKQSLEDLVEGVEPFDLTSFKVYSAKEKKYKSIKDFCMPEGLNKNTFREQIKELNSILFNIEKNSFPELAKTHHK